MRRVPTTQRPRIFDVLKLCLLLFCWFPGGEADEPGVGLLGGTTGCERMYAVFMDGVSSLGSWLLSGLALIGTFEVSRALLSVPELRESAAQAFLVVGTTVAISWIMLVTVLVVAYKWIVVGNLRDMGTERVTAKRGEANLHEAEHSWKPQNKLIAY